MAQIHTLTESNFTEVLYRHEKPKVGIIAPKGLCSRWTEGFETQDYDVVLIPVGMPNIETIIDNLDAMLLPGGDTHVHPSHYKKELIEGIDILQSDTFDIERDLYAFSAINEIVKQKLPTLAICRGAQEIGVYFGVPLSRVDEVHSKGYASRKADGSRCFETMDSEAHHITLSDDSRVKTLFNNRSLVMVNSVHEQGIYRDDWEKALKLRSNCNIDAMAGDGVVEIFSSKNFYLFCAQAHFELIAKGRILHDAVYNDFFRHIEQRFENRLNGSKNKAFILSPQIALDAR